MDMARTHTTMTKKEQYIGAAVDRIKDWCRDAGCEIPDIAYTAISAELGAMFEANPFRAMERSRAASGFPAYYFALERDPTEDAYGQFYIVSEEFWGEHHCLDDRHISANVQLPKGFNEVMESTFAFEGGTSEEGRDALLSAGFQENASLLP